MKVDKIIACGKTRSKVIFDDGFTLILYNGELKKWHIEADKELSVGVYDKEIRPTLDKRARERLVGILKESDRSESQLREKLRESSYPQSCIDSAVEWAISRHYVDDERYADNYLRYHSEGKSRKKLMYDLMNRGLDRDLIIRMLEDTPVDEDAQIRRELEKRGYSQDMDRKERQRIIAALARKGYSWETISRLIGEDI